MSSSHVRPVVSCPLPGGKGRRFALIRMGHDSRHEPNVAESTEARLDEALDRHDGDLWAALEHSAVIAPGSRGAVTPEPRRRVPEVVAGQRGPEFEEPDAGLVPGDPCDHLPPSRKGTA